MGYGKYIAAFIAPYLTRVYHFDLGTVQYAIHNSDRYFI